MGNLQSTPSSSNTTLGKKYDVFLSFRGEDTRDCFTSHLYEALRRKQIETFIDNQLIRGDEISPALTRVIEESKISVVIFSKDYASSKWCLRELVEILKCKEMNNQIVLPVFYRVDPSDVRNQTGSFKDSFVKHEKELQEKVQEEVQTWRKALTKASKLSGWDSSITRTDATLVDEIVNDIWKKLMSEYILPDFGGLIGLERIEHILSLLCLHVMTDVRIIGIWGMGGIGKTTLANAIFNQNSSQFEGVCFIQNVRENLENHGGLVSMQKEILSKVLNDEDLKLDSLTIPPKIKERLNRLKVFIVLDDVDDSLKMETLVKGVDGLGQGSRIIITSRDKQVLRNCRVIDDNIYEVKGFNYHEALQFFCNYAFDENRHSENLMVNWLVNFTNGNPLAFKVLGSSLYKKSKEEWENCHSENLMVNRLVNFTNGNPLALKVLGSSLYKKSKEEWESVVNKFEPTNLSREIFDVLKISYNGLKDIEKDLFLDIACFLKGKTRDYVAKILDDCYYSLSVLVDRSLITISSYDHKIKMHDLLEEMGRDIVNKDSPIKIGKRSRLWRQEDVICTLKNDIGTPKVQGIVLDMIKIKKDIHLSPQFFKKMYNLRLLKFYNSTYNDYSKVNCLEDLVHYMPWWFIRYKFPLQAPFYDTTYSNYSKVNFSEGPSVLSDKLRSLIWYGYPLQALPSNFNPNNLVELDLRGSNLERLWEDCMDVPKLRWLNLSRCTRVTKIPDLSKSPLLEKINLEECSSLLDFPQLAQHLKNLRYLYRKGCNNLRSFPSDIHFESLTSLVLSNCNNLTKFPQISGNIKFLDLSGTAIEELHHSIAHLNGLAKLFLRNCKNLEMLPSSICNLTSLQWLDLSDCSRLEILPENLGNLKSLSYLSADRTAIKELPHSIAHLNGLEGLYLVGCENLKTLPSGIRKLTSLQYLYLSDCSRLEMLPENLGNLKSLKFLLADKIAISQLPSSMENLKKLEMLSSREYRDLRFIHSSGLPCSLEILNLDNCNMILSLIDLPSNLTHLSACDCKQLQSIPNELVFARIINPAETAVSNMLAPTKFIFTNCMNLEETAVGNMLARLMKYLHQEYIKFNFFYPGSEVPKWFRYTTEGSSIKFQKPFDCIIKGFAVCAVIAFEKYLFSGDSQHKLGVHFHCTFSDGDQSPRRAYNIMSDTVYVASRNRTLIDSDHVAFGYLNASYHWLLRERFNNYSFEFRLTAESPNCRLKSCGVCPIYFQDPDIDDSDEAGTSGSRFDEEEMEPHLKENENLQTVKYAEPIEHIGERSGIRRSRTSNDHPEEEVEPHPKRLNI